MIVALDSETTISNKGNVNDSRNKLMCFSWKRNTAEPAGAARYNNAVQIQGLVDESSLIVGFHFKFDLAWFRKVGVDFSKAKIWDVQIAEFILSCQKNKFPSLDATCEKYGITKKTDVVKTEYWDKGIDTDQIPWPILQDYSAHDAHITLQCYHAQLKYMSPAQVRLCQLMCQDQVVLQEMEANGITLDVNLCKRRNAEVQDEIASLNKTLSEYYPHIPINFNSNDDLSAFLYGGTITEEIRVVDGFYKTGAKAGQPKLKKQEIEHTLPRLFTPLKGSEMKKEGNFAVDEGTLRKLTGKHKSVVDLLLRLAKLDKLQGTYYNGLPKLIEEMHWPEGKLHGQLNQCLAQTGRLSSSKPNQQNFASELQDIFISDYT